MASMQPRSPGRVLVGSKLLAAALLFLRILVLLLRMALAATATAATATVLRRLLPHRRLQLLHRPRHTSLPPSATPRRTLCCPPRGSERSVCRPPLRKWTENCPRKLVINSSTREITARNRRVPQLHCTLQRISIGLHPPWAGKWTGIR